MCLIFIGIEHTYLILELCDLHYFLLVMMCLYYWLFFMGIFSLFLYSWRLVEQHITDETSTL